VAFGVELPDSHTLVMIFRYGYNSLNNTKQVWSRTREAGIPRVRYLLAFFICYFMYHMKVTLCSVRPR